MSAPPILSVKAFADQLIRLASLEQSASGVNLGERMEVYESLVWMFSEALKRGDELHSRVEYLQAQLVRGDE